MSSLRKNVKKKKEISETISFIRDDLVDEV